jgi:alkylation response protein AidB-like acyl-CoA dehydrogenase
MPSYAAPLEDYRFILEDVLDISRITALPGHEEHTPDLLRAVLAEAGKLATEILHPLNLPGDAIGCRYENGTVTTPPGFVEAYRRFRDGGWTGTACDPAHGGQDLPNTVFLALQEILSAANLAFSLYPCLSHAAYVAIARHATPDLKARYLPPLAEGRWSGTMCLTEPQCGTDLGLLRTRAEPAPDGAYRLTGNKIFISAGEHDLTENIIHLVLARLPGAPAGVRGISLFLVPKFLPDSARNAVYCTGIEHKMGLRASATCALGFDGATGWLVGEPHKGLRAMFTMMNTARLGVGLQALGLADIAYQNALAYARDRRQGRALAGTGDPDQSADLLLVHPDIRRTLLTIKAFVEGGRMLSCWTGMALDRQSRDPDPERRREAEDLVALMTPVIKALFTDLGFEAANLGLQVYGGHGYIHANGMEQFVRDARITQIYEGANGIQALDLVGRKLAAHNGRLLRRFFHPVHALIEATSPDPVLGPLAAPLAKAFGRLQQATAAVAAKGLKNPDEAAAVATDYLRLFGLVALGAMWLMMADAARRPAGTAAPALRQAKLATAGFFMAKRLPEVDGLFKAVMAGAAPIAAVADAFF